MNPLLEYVSVKGSGRRAEILAAARALNVPNVWKTIEAFIELGHLEWEPLTNGGHWSCTQPVLARLPVKALRYVACGQRSPELHELLVARLHVQRVPQPDSADAWLCEAANESDIIRACADVGLGFTPRAAAQTLASALPTLESYLASPTVTRRRLLPAFAEEPKRWTPDGGWVVGPFRREAGMWLIRERHRSYSTLMFATPTDTYQLGDSGAGQAMLCRASEGLIGYDSTNRTVVVRAWASLPRPWRRVLALCSGLAPQRDDQGRLHYTSVPEYIAKVVAVRLGTTLPKVKA